MSIHSDARPPQEVTVAGPTTAATTGGPATGATGTGAGSGAGSGVFRNVSSSYNRKLWLWKGLH